MYLSDFVFFTFTISLIVFLGLLASWEHIDHYTDWNKKVHTSLKKTLDEFSVPDVNYIPPSTVSPAEIKDRVIQLKEKSRPKLKPFDCSPIKPTGNNAMTRTTPPFKMFIHPVKTDIHVSGSIKRSGVWEGAQISLFTEYLEEYPTSLFVDVGLNIGMYGLVAAANKHKVIGFEPLLLNLNRVCSSINYNNFNDMVTIYPYAITNTVTKVSFRTPKENAGGTSVSDNKLLAGVENIDFANAYTFDSFNISYDGPILMKIDIEGHECQMFEKINKYFDENDVKLIMIEWGQLVKKCGNQIANILLGHGLLPYDAAGRNRFSLSGKPWSKGVWDMVWKEAPRPTKAILNKQKWKWCKKFGNYQDQLYDQLSKTNDALEEVNITHVIAYGTLIGAARNQNINMNEVDNDVILEKSWVKKRNIFEKALLKRGLFMFNDGIPRICHLADMLDISSGQPWKTGYLPYTDIYDHVTMTDEYKDQKWGNNLTFKPWFIMRLKIRDKWFPVPNIYEKLLKIKYGDDWRDPNGSRKDINWDGKKFNKAVARDK
jgi:FkbM family methyltransferase